MEPSPKTWLVVCALLAVTLFATLGLKSMLESDDMNGNRPIVTNPCPLIGDLTQPPNANLPGIGEVRIELACTPLYTPVARPTVAASPVAITNRS